MPLPIAAIFAQKAAGIALNEAQKPGGANRLLAFGLGGGLAVILVPILLLAVLVNSIGSSFTSMVATDVAERGLCPTSTSQGFQQAALIGEGDEKNNALTVARVMKEEGLGERGVQLGVTVAFAESGLLNHPYGLGTSRGLFQQLEGWAWGGPDSRKWLGPWSGKTPPDGKVAADYFRQSNAYQEESWAANDSRMDPVAATTAFAQALKTNLRSRGISWKEWAANPALLTDQELFDTALMVQRFQNSGNARQNYINKIQSAKPYVKLATGAQAYSDVVDTTNDPSGDREQNGVLILGDSIANQMAAAAPEVGFGGKITSYAFDGASAQQFLETNYVRADGLNANEAESTIRSAPTRMVVSLGTNNPISVSELRDNLRDLFRMASPATVIYLVEVHNDLTGGTADEYNQMFAELAVQFNAKKKWADMVVVETGDLWAVEGNRDYDGMLQQGTGMPIHWSEDGKRALWDRVATIMSGGDPVMATAIFPDCDPSTEAAPTYVPPVDLSALEKAVTVAQAKVDKMCTVAGADCVAAKQELIDAQKALEDAKSTSGAVATAIAYAREQIGEPYWSDPPGARPPDSWDCSKLTYYAYKQAGVDLGAAYSYTQWEVVKRVTKESVQPGDLVFWFRNAHHVALVDRVDSRGIHIVEAANPDAGVRERYLGGSWDDSHLSGFGRPPAPGA